MQAWMLPLCQMAVNQARGGQGFGALGVEPHGFVGMRLRHVPLAKKGCRPGERDVRVAIEGIERHGTLPRRHRTRE